MVQEQQAHQQLQLFYQKEKKYTAALNRYKLVIDSFQETKFAPEALYRVSEIYLSIGMREESEKNAAILGMNILTGLTKDGNEWSGGKILDPKNGKEYKCYLQLLDNNTLKLRGYIGISMFGRTAIWKRAKKNQISLVYCYIFQVENMSFY